MMLKLVLIVAWVSAARAGIVQPLGYQSIAAPIPQAYYSAGISAPIGASIARIQPAIGAPFARIQPAISAPIAGYRIDRPLASQVLAPTAHIAAAPLTASVAKTIVSEEYDPNPQYTFSYDVQDALTGDNKNQIESRNGDLVQGSYSLNDADGTRRTVEYTADPVNGFNAIVRREPLIAAAPAVAKVATPVALAAPAIARFASPAYAPLGYSSIASGPLLSKTIIH